MDSMERHGHLKLDPEVRSLLFSASAATLDRLLKPIRTTAGSRRRRRRRPSMGRQIPVRTFNDWNRPPPGFLEIDLVAHCGGSLSGSFIHSLVATDICTGWTEAVPLLAREQSLVVEGLEAIARQLPFQVLGIDSDNDSAFINGTLVQYCAQWGIEFTLSRAYRKNDQAWIEQKNGSVIRRFTGHDRYSGRIAGQTMVHLYQAVRLYVNYFQPSFKLLGKMRDGARTIKRYSPPATPCDRLMQYDTIAARTKEELSEYRPGWTRWGCCGPSERPSRHWQRYPHPSLRKLFPVKAWTGFWPACPACGNRGKPGPRIRRGCAHLATGAPARTPSRACGARCCCGSRKILTPTPRTCWRDCAKLIPTGLEMLSCEHSSAGSRAGVESWPRNWYTPLPMSPYWNRETEANWS